MPPLYFSFIILPLVFLASAPLSSSNSHRTTSLSSPRLLLVSFDGFRHDYLEKTATPNFDRLVENGSRAKWVKDAFISKTFPNHFTIVTGLYEESHGIVSNSFYDPSLGEIFDMSSSEAKWWSVGAEPIWVTNRLQRPESLSGVYFWPGSDAPIKDLRPDYYEKYDSSVPMRRRIDKVVSWLKSYPNLNLALLYYHEPDHTAHFFGPDSPQVMEKIRLCDEFVGYLLDSLTSAGLMGNDASSPINLIITSDHGFTNLTDPNSITVIERHLRPKGIEYEALGSSPVLGIWPKQKDNATAVVEIYNALKAVQAPISVYLREEVPAYFRYSTSDRIAPVVVQADFGYGLVGYESSVANYSERRGEHGYDNREMDMHPFFVATGPAFKSGGYLSEPFNNVDIYPLMCHILGLTPAPNNGSLANVCSLMRIASCDIEEAFSNLGFWVFTVLGLGISVLVAAVYVFVTVRRHRRLPRPAFMKTFPKSLVESPSSSDLRWDDDDDVETVFRPDESRISKWRSWSANWKRKWHLLRRSRVGVKNGEGESLMLTSTTTAMAAPTVEELKDFDDLQQLPSHLASAFRR